jgi:hypothetical protein
MAELTFATVTILKEVYLLSRFVARTAKSAAHSSSERDELHNELGYEHTVIKSFGLFFFHSDGVVISHEALNAEWLERIKWILDGLRLAHADYAKLAAERDDVYAKFSPYLKEHGESQGQNRLIGFGELDVRPQTTETSATQHGTDSSKRKLFPSLDWRWALSEKKELERILATSRNWTAKLKEVVQLTMAVNQRYHLSASLESLSLAGNDNAKRLGLVGHAKVRHNIEAATTGDVIDLDKLRGATVELPRQRTTLTPAVLRHRGLSETVLVEMKPLPEVTSEEDETSILKLAQLLALSSGTSLSTIPLRGVLRLEGDNAYAFVFDFPPRTTDAPPTTLFDLIRRPHSITPGLPLPQRFRVAQSIAKSLNALHADNWVHKSFRSRSIVFFHSDDGILTVKPYLVDFEFSRSTNSATSWTYDDDVEKNLYRHPLRQRPPQKSFNQSHDLYALGVVLLEIGLWRTASSIKEQAQAALESGEVLDPETLAEYYIRVAERDLIHTMGSAFANAVIMCLNGSFDGRVTDTAFPLIVYSSVVDGLDPKRLLDYD